MLKPVKFDFSFYVESNATKQKLHEVEGELMSHFSAFDDHVDLKQESECKLEVIEDLLSKRRWILNQLWEWTAVNIDRLKAVNSHIRFLSDKLYARVKSMESKAMRICDDREFDDDYEIEGTLEFVYNDSDSVLKLDDDDDYGSDFTRMVNIIYEYYHNTGDFGKYALKIHPKSKNMDEGVVTNWNRFRSMPELEICYATHNFLFHALYSLPDLIRLNDFWTEVRFIEQSITDQTGKRFSRLYPETS